MDNSHKRNLTASETDGYKPFLRLVAETYLEKEGVDKLADFCFVTPNKRSALFLSKYIKELSGASLENPVIAPQIITIDKFINSLVPELEEASRYEQLLTLYNEYKKLSPGALEFDRFRFWGDMLLGDFSDVDRYMADAEKLFVNIKRLREIGSTYLTEEQAELIRLYWGEEKAAANIEQFWTHTAPEDTSGREEDGDSIGDRFVKLWEILGPLYESFNTALESAGIASSGRLYRRAVDNLKRMRDDALWASRYVFVGFNVLSTSEIKIFEMLKAMGRADFYWDTNSPALRDKACRWGKHLRRNAKMFSSLYALDEPKIEHISKIHVVGVPSKTGQAKYAAKVLKDLADNNIIKDKNNAINTAVVLADESLLTPLIHALPEDLTDVNVTMGYPLKLTPVSSLIRRITSMYLRSRQSRGETLYYYEDVISIATHPLLGNIDREQCTALVSMINRQRLITISNNRITECAPALAPVFRGAPQTPRDFNATRDYLEGVLYFIESGSNRHGDAVIEAWRRELESLGNAVERFGVTMDESTVLQLIESAVSSARANFSGRPLKGLQVMGMLETRALDFDNVIILSMNERVFPRRTMGGSFIPETLRRGHGMATAETREAVSAYYFFRLMSRARNVTLVYDSRNIGAVGGGEKSRYITQLLYLGGGNDKDRVTHQGATYSATTFSRPALSVEKTPEVMEKLKRFTVAGSGKNFSASSLNAYINCPLQFYLTMVEGLKEPDEISDFMDSSTYGTIVHSIMEKLYTGLRPDPSRETPVEITSSVINSLIDSKSKIENLVTVEVNRNYNKITSESRLTEPLEGDSYALGRLITMQVTEMLKEELKFTPFTFIGAEIETVTRLSTASGITINFKQLIDRVDRRGDTTRIVDYKTGPDPVQFGSLEDLFNGKLQSRPKAVLQLLIYSWVYKELSNPSGPMQPIIYSFRSLGSDGINPISMKNATANRYEPLTDCIPLLPDLKERIDLLISEIFDPNIPFASAMSIEGGSDEESTSDKMPKVCALCHFKALCER